jgi:SPX domain protein involved in polyphosphate accumulation
MERISVENIILSHPAFFSEVYHERYVNNIYFDNLNFSNFDDNINGNIIRKKYRIRWYGKMLSEIENPNLELKARIGLIGTKESYVLKPFKLDKGICISHVVDLINDSNINSTVKFTLRDQLPVLLNRYRRRYYESNDKKFRITIDDDQSFYKIKAYNNEFLYRNEDSDSIIVELKYNLNSEPEVAAITNAIPFRLTKSSKFARGIELLYS